MTDQGAAVVMLLFMFYWVPFALGAYVSEHWSDPLWREHRSHPIRYMREFRPMRHAAAH